MRRIHLYRHITILSLIVLAISLDAQSFDVDTLYYRGDANQHINIVILGDGYLESELPQFRNDAKSFTDYLFEVEPFSNYQTYFNAFAISVPSNEKGAAMHPDSLIDNYFGSTFWYADIERLLFPTNRANITNVLAENFPSYDQVVMLVNSTKYGGSGGWVATASLNKDSKEIAIHELGHSFSDLADEYWAGEQYARERINMTQETDLDNLKWRNWYGDNDIGLYSHDESPDWYRPHQGCKMRYLGYPFCSVCLEATIERVYSLVSPLKDYIPNTGSLTEPDDTSKFKLFLTKPKPNTLKITWKLNDLEFDANVDSILIHKTDLIDGQNVVSAIIEDTTVLIRPYADETYHLTTVIWTISSNPNGQTVLASQPGSHVVGFYPNPLDDYLKVRIQGEVSGSLKLELYDTHGKRVRTYLLESSGVVTLSLSDLNQGVYMAMVYINNDLITSTKIIKY